ncbi:unnamed protein product [Onchocerca flexuosa]|uniref:DUF2007 domain-containing protein n=1 Tax=Onchocerca flexuosa TaxID=387005 RepID=A0A183GZ58_9BILA|nr:unnamed protein product [Onchocerca flexuosa]
MNDRLKVNEKQEMNVKDDSVFSTMRLQSPCIPTIWSRTREAWPALIDSWIGHTSPAEVLPLVEFIVSDDINLEEARQLINAEPPLGQIENPLQEQMSLKTGKVMANREILLRLEKQQVIIAEWPPPFATRFYYNIIPEISIIQCNSCYRMFHADDFEIACLKTGGCPFCHVAPQKKTNRNFIGDNDIE